MNRIGYVINPGVTAEDAATGTVASSGTMGISLEFTDRAGAPLTSLQVGQEFLINIYAQDLRDQGNAMGVISAFTDVSYDTSLIDVTGIVHAFDTYTSGIVNESNGKVDAVGGLKLNASGQSNRDPQLVFSLQAVAAGEGLLTVTTDSPETELFQNTMFGDDTDVRSQTSFGIESIQIDASSQATFDLTTLASGTYTAGEVVPIRWTAGGVTPESSVNLAYDTDTVWGAGRETWFKFGLSTANGEGVYDWDTTGVAPGTYYIGGYLYDHQEGVATFSHLTQSFTIQAATPTFELTDPASETYAVGQVIPIQWTASSVAPGSSINLAYDTDADWGGDRETWFKFGETAANGNGTYYWDTTGVAPGTYYIAGYLYDHTANTATFSHLAQSFTIGTASGSSDGASSVSQADHDELTQSTDADAATENELQPLATAAVSACEKADITTEDVDVASSVESVIAELSNVQVSLTTSDTISIDHDSAVRRWRAGLARVETRQPASAFFSPGLGTRDTRLCMNSLTVTAHESGHVSDANRDIDDDATDDLRSIGLRRLPGKFALIDAAFSADWDDFLIE